jgi:hypothetical protein
MARLRRLLAPLLAVLLFAQAATAAAACLRLAGGHTLAVEICTADGTPRTLHLPAGDTDEAPHARGFCAACHALPAAPAAPGPLAAPSAPPLPGRVAAPAMHAPPHADAAPPYRATGPPAA